MASIQQVFCLGLIIVGALFLGADSLRPGAMASELYGAPAYALDASWWAVFTIFPAMLSFLGLRMNGEFLYSPTLKAVGYLWLFGVFSAIFYSALFAEFGLVLVAFSGGFFLPMLGCFFAHSIEEQRVRLNES